MSAPMEKTRYSGIYRRGSRYVIKWRHEGKQHKQSFATLQEAVEAKGRRQAGDSRPPNRQPFADYARAWIDSYQGRTARTLSDSTRKGYRRGIERWAIPCLGSKRMDAIGPRDIRAFVAYMQERGAGPSSQHSHMVAVKALFATAFEDGDIRANPTVGVRLRIERDEETKAKAMTAEEFAHFLAACPQRWRGFFAFLGQTGLRISEALALTWDDVELGTKPRVRVTRQFYQGKITRLKTSYSRREVPLSPGTVDMLLALRKEAYWPERPIWATKTGTHISVSNLRNRVLKPTAKSVGLDIGFHTFRHTCASLLFANGKNVKQVQRWLGHAKASFTLDTYVHLVDDELGDASFFDADPSGAVSTVSV